ncbi:MAG TPA: YicC family protein [Geoalkalibacter subterraneus]|uniref:YicC family protein n=1 Tax=Geoalkalibacter subterraneus TaxID=483547 RepID=A0A831LEQ3_9BACT|nr:YicC family protein [Geoalkalibacter subterraneus]
MIKSMTGYGKGQGESEKLSLTVEIKTVNHRFGDVNVKAPRFLMGYDHEIKKRVSQRLRRGKIDLFISQDSQEKLTAAPAFNPDLAEAYVEMFRRMTTAYDLKDDLSLSLLAAQKDVIVLEDCAVAAEEIRQCLDQALESAVDAVESMRAAEGRATQEDIAVRLDLIDEVLEKVVTRAPEVVQEWQVKLKQRLERLASEVDFDEQRVAQEVALFADRCDISEEIARFRSHLQQFHDLLEQQEPVGRQLDFLVQELNREANTMGSKSNDSQLTRQVVQLKAELEKIKEQVQNVE